MVVGLVSYGRLQAGPQYSTPSSEIQYLEVANCPLESENLQTPDLAELRSRMVEVDSALPRRELKITLLQ